jgi:hypothetical protein
VSKSRCCGFDPRCNSVCSVRLQLYGRPRTVYYHVLIDRSWRGWGWGNLNDGVACRGKTTVELVANRATRRLSPVCPTALVPWQVLIGPDVEFKVHWIG